MKVRNEPPPHPRPQQQGSAAAASSNWTDQTTASLRGSPLRTPRRYRCSCCLNLWPPASLRPALSLPAPDPSPAFEVPGPPERSESSQLPAPHAYTQLLEPPRWRANCAPALKDLQGSRFHNLCRNLVLTSRSSPGEESLLFMKSQFLSLAMSMEWLLVSASLSYT